MGGKFRLELLQLSITKPIESVGIFVSSTVRSGERQCATTSQITRRTRVICVSCCSNGSGGCSCMHTRAYVKRCVPKVRWCDIIGKEWPRRYIHRRVSRFIYPASSLCMRPRGPRAKVCGRRHVRRAWLITYKRHCKSRRCCRRYLYAVGRETRERGRLVCADAARMLLSREVEVAVMDTRFTSEKILVLWKCHSYSHSSKNLTPTSPNSKCKLYSNAEKKTWL